MKFSRLWVKPAESTGIWEVTSPALERTRGGGTKRFGEQDGSEIRWRGGRYRVRAAG